MHDSFQDRFKHARIWGKSAKHDNQRVGLDHKLHDEDIIEINKEQDLNGVFYIVMTYRKHRAIYL